MSAETTVTSQADYTNTVDDYEEHDDSKTSGTDLDAMRKRVASIAEEAAQITAMSAPDDTAQKKSDLSRSPRSTKSPSVASAASGSGASSPKLLALASAGSSEKANVDSQGTATTPKEGSNEASDGSEFPATLEEQAAIDARSVFVGSLVPSIDANDMKGHFESCGTIERITIVCDKYHGTPKGCAYIQFKSQESVAAACLLNDKPLKGHYLKVDVKRTNLPPWMRPGRGRGGRSRYGRGRGRGRGWRGRGYYGGGYNPYRGRGGGGYYAYVPSYGYPY